MVLTAGESRFWRHRRDDFPCSAKRKDPDMNCVLREAARLVVAAVLIVSIGSVGTVFADGDEPVAVELRAAPRVDVPAMPEEMELLSDIVTELLSGNVTKFLADNCARFLSGNSPELLSGNETELLSENDTQLFSGNKPELLSGNKIQLFSNVSVSISIAESGNNNGAPPAAVARQSLLLQQKKKLARPSTVHDHGHGTVQPQKHSTTKSTKKARRAKRRFEALDANGDGVLSFEELQGHGRTDRTVATSERR